MRELFEKIVAWQNKTFPGATAESKVHHLTEEVQELLSDIQNGATTDDLELEFADCFLLLFGAAQKVNLDYNDLVNAIEKKFKINTERDWGKPDENGVVKHVKSE